MSLQQTLIEYAKSYRDRFNSLVASLQPSSLAHSVVEARIIPGKEGAAIFYLPDDMAGWSPNFLPQGPKVTEAMPLKNGVQMLPDDTDPLGLILQRITHNLVKVQQPPRNAPISDASQLLTPPDLPRDFIICSGSLNPAFLRDHAGDATLLGMTANPLFFFDEGICTAWQPTRRHLISPVLRDNFGNFYRQFSWSFLQVMWFPDKLDLTPQAAAFHAENEGTALRWIIPDEATGTGNKPTAVVATGLKAILQNFDALINDPSVDEHKVQEFLERPKSQFILYPTAISIVPRKKLGHGKYEIDFVCERPDGDYHFIEIEDPKKAIYQPKGEEPSAHFGHAITQVHDWLRFVDSHRDFAEKQDGLKGIFKPTGEVIAGRDSHLVGEAKARFDYARKHDSLRLRTYDMVVADAKAYIAMIEKL